MNISFAKIDKESQALFIQNVPVVQKLITTGKSNPWQHTIGLFYDQSPFGSLEKQSLDLSGHVIGRATYNRLLLWFIDTLAPSSIVVKTNSTITDKHNERYSNAITSQTISVSNGISQPAASVSIDFPISDSQGELLSNPSPATVGVYSKLPIDMQIMPSEPVAASETHTTTTFPGFGPLFVVNATPSQLQTDIPGPTAYLCEHATFPHCQMNAPAPCFEVQLTVCTLIPEESMLPFRAVVVHASNSSITINWFSSKYCSATPTDMTKVALNICHRIQIGSLGMAIQVMTTCDKSLTCILSSPPASPVMHNEPIFQKNPVPFFPSPSQNSPCEVVRLHSTHSPSASQSADGLQNDSKFVFVFVLEAETMLSQHDSNSRHYTEWIVENQRDSRTDENVLGVTAFAGEFNPTKHIKKPLIGSLPASTLYALTCGNVRSSDLLEVVPSLDLYVHALCDRSANASILVPDYHLASLQGREARLSCTGFLQWTFVGSYNVTSRLPSAWSSNGLRFRIHKVDHSSRLFIDKVTLVPGGSPVHGSILQGHMHPPCAIATNPSTCVRPRCEWHITKGCVSSFSLQSCETLPSALCPARCDLKYHSNSTLICGNSIYHPSLYTNDNLYYSEIAHERHRQICTINGICSSLLARVEGKEYGNNISFVRISDIVGTAGRLQRWYTTLRNIYIYRFISSRVASCLVSTAVVQASHVSTNWIPFKHAELLAVPGLLAHDFDVVENCTENTFSPTWACPFKISGVANHLSIIVQCIPQKFILTLHRVGPFGSELLLEGGIHLDLSLTKLDVHLEGGIGYFEWRGHSLILSQLQASTNYTVLVTIYQKSYCSNNKDVNDDYNCKDIAAEYFRKRTLSVSFQTTKQLLSPRQLKAHVLSSQEAILQWRFNITQLISLHSSIISINKQEPLQTIGKLLFRIFVDGVPRSHIPAAASVGYAHFPKKNVSCTVNTDGNLMPTVPDIYQHSMAFEAVIRDLEPGVRHRLSVQAYILTIGPISRRAIPTFAKMHANHVDSKIEVKDVVNHPRPDNTLVVTVTWQATRLGDGALPIMYEVEALNRGKRGVRFPAFHGFVSELGLRLQLTRFYEISIRPHFFHCWLQNYHECTIYVSPHLLPPHTQIYEATEFFFDLFSVPVVHMHTLEGSSIIFELLENIEVIAVQCWASIDSNGRHVAASQLLDLQLSQVDTSISVSVPLKPFTEYQFMFRTQDNLHSSPYSLISPQAEPTSPILLSTITTSERSLSVDIGVPDPLNGVLQGYRVALGLILNDGNIKSQGSVFVPFKRLFMEPDLRVRFTVDGLMPLTLYTVSFVASTEAGEGPGNVIQAITIANNTEKVDQIQRRNGNMLGDYNLPFAKMATDISATRHCEFFY